ncbi:MAG: TadE/TadG family type IV pilus assembly protein [Halothiobacillus sp.]
MKNFFLINKCPASRRRQKGQSLVEMAISLIVLVPLAASVMLLGQFIHIKLQTQAAAREAAWAATVDPALANAGLPDITTEQTRLRLHQFADANTALRSNGTGLPQFADPMLTTFAGNPLLSPNDLTLTVYQQKAAPSYLDAALNIVGGALNTLPPNKQGLVTAEVHANTAKILSRSGVPLAFLGSLADQRLDFSAATVLLTDAWDAAGGGETLNGQPAGGQYANRTVRGVIEPMVPSSRLGGGAISAIHTAAGLLGSIPLMKDILTPNFDKFELGRTAPDVVPDDKLVK